MGIFSWLVLGLVAGVLAKLLMPGKDPGGFFVTILIGIFGSYLGVWLGGKLGLGGMQSLNLEGIITATAGAFVLLFIYRLLKKK